MGTLEKVQLAAAAQTEASLGPRAGLLAYGAIATSAPVLHVKADAILGALRCAALADDGSAFERWCRAWTASGAAAGTFAQRGASLGSVIRSLKPRRRPAWSRALLEAELRRCESAGD